MSEDYCDDAVHAGRWVAQGLGAMVKRYLAIKEKALRPTSYARVKCYLEETWKDLHNEPIDSIKRADVALILEDVAGARGRVCARPPRAARSLGTPCTTCCAALVGI